MNKLYAAVIIVEFINLVVLVVGIVIVHEFKDFKELCNSWRFIKKADQELYRMIVERYKTMEESFERQYHIFKLMTKRFEAICSQYKTISELQDEYRKLCKECVDHYGDAYEQFKLCSDKLDRMSQPQVSVSPEDFKNDDEDIVI